MEQTALRAFSVLWERLKDFTGFWTRKTEEDMNTETQNINHMSWGFELSVSRALAKTEEKSKSVNH